MPLFWRAGEDSPDATVASARTRARQPFTERLAFYNAKPPCSNLLFVCTKNRGSPFWCASVLARRRRFELPTFWSVARRSIQLSYRRIQRRSFSDRHSIITQTIFKINSKFKKLFYLSISSLNRSVPLPFSEEKGTISTPSASSPRYSFISESIFSVSRRLSLSLFVSTIT